jgi:uracil-DNA glycosylase family 4
MTKEQALNEIAAEIRACRPCKKGGVGKAVPGEGNPEARVVFVGEAPGKEEAKIGRPFIGRSGKFLRKMIHELGLEEHEVFITSPGHYLPIRGTPTKEMLIHGREHLFKQLSVIKPKFVVLLGNSACVAMLDSRMEISRSHGTIIEKEGRKYFITFHPAYAMRFPAGKKLFIRDFSELGRILKAGLA